MSHEVIKSSSKQQKKGDHELNRSLPIVQMPSISHCRFKALIFGFPCHMSDFIFGRHIEPNMTVFSPFGLSFWIPILSLATKNGIGYAKFPSVLQPQSRAKSGNGESPATSKSAKFHKYSVYPPAPEFRVRATDLQKK